MNPVRCSPGDLVAWSGGDQMVRAFAPSATRGWWADGAVAMIAIDAELRVPTLIGVGSHTTAAALVTAAAEELAAEGGGLLPITVPRGAIELLPAWLRPRETDQWEWRAVAEPPPARAGADGAGWLDEAAYGEVTAVLTAASPGSSVWPGDPAARRWAGVRAGGRLAACLADTSRTDGVGHISGVATAPDARGAGHGAAVTAWAVRRLFAEGAGLVTLGVYSDNAPARRLYDRLGFSADHSMSSGEPPA